jgi:hypothetical protein
LSKEFSAADAMLTCVPAKTAADLRVTLFGVKGSASALRPVVLSNSLNKGGAKAFRMDEQKLLTIF